MSEGICIAVIGIVGTLAGTVLGWFLNNLSRRGKLRLFVVKWNEGFELNDAGRFVATESIGKAELYSYDLTLNVYNSSSDTRIMQAFRVQFLSSGNVVLSGIPGSSSSKETSGLAVSDHKIETMNVPPKSVIPLHINGGFWRSECKGFDSINDADLVRLVYKDEKGRDRQIEVGAPIAGC